MVATFEGAHSINVSRLLQAEDQKTEGPFKHPERHILDNVTVFGMKYTHIVVIECALYLYEMLADGGHIERLADEKWRLRPSFVTTDEAGFFSTKQDWLAFAGGLIFRSVRPSVRSPTGFGQSVSERRRRSRSCHRGSKSIPILRTLCGPSESGIHLGLWPRSGTSDSRSPRPNGAIPGSGPALHYPCILSPQQ